MPFNIVEPPKGSDRSKPISANSRRVKGYGETYEEAVAFKEKWYPGRDDLEIWIQVGDQCVPAGLKT